MDIPHTGRKQLVALPNPSNPAARLGEAKKDSITEGRFVLLAMFMLDGAYFKGISVLSQSVTITVAAVWVLLVVNPDLLVPTRRIIRQQHKQKNEESLPPDTYSPEWKGLVAMRDGLLRIFRRRR